jgi:hypothetical protein
MRGAAILRRLGNVGSSSGIDPELLERLRRGVPLRLTATGNFRWGDEDITHPGVRRALRSGLDVTEDGEAIVRIGQHWCYITVEDVLFRVNAVEVDGEVVRLRLDDGRVAVLDPETLWEEPDRGLRVAVPTAGSGRSASARFTNRAQLELAEWIEMEQGPPILALGSRRIVIPSSAP